MHETRNHQYASYVLKSNDIKWVVIAPYLSEFTHPVQMHPHPNFDGEYIKNWVARHGNGVAVIGIRVASATEAYNKAIGIGETDSENWAIGRMPPTVLEFQGEQGSVIASEIIIYGDTILRFIEYRDGFKGAFLPGYEPYDDPTPLDYGIQKMDHVVGNTYELDAVVTNLKKWLGFHEFAFFTKEDIQTEWTSLNSTVMANNTNSVLLPINEPAKKKKESQITEYLKANNGPGVQHIALFTPDILSTVKIIHASGGFELISTPKEYYNDKEITNLLNKHFPEDKIKLVKEFGILIDQDYEGVLLQIFTKPIFDRPTLFCEIIQRICHGEVVDKPGCGGFGKGNFRALFQSIERLQAARGMLLEENQDDVNIN